MSVCGFGCGYVYGCGCGLGVGMDMNVGLDVSMYVDMLHILYVWMQVLVWVFQRWPGCGLNYFPL